MLENATRVNGNAIIIHGGGLVEPSKFVLLEIARQLSEKNVYPKIYIGRYSFESLYTPEFLLEYNEELETELENKRGTWFGTCRGIDLTDPILFSRALTCMKKRNVSTLIVAGGDGSARQCAETQELFERNGINIIFPVPLTVDGINGGDSIGITQAVREVIRQTENVVATSLETRDNGTFSVVIVETQGRNRDDIMANVLQHFHLNRKIADVDIEDILLIAIPANMKTDAQRLIERVNYSRRRTLILISEGADIKISDLTKGIKRKVRTVVVGHQVQSNNLMTDEDKKVYAQWIKILTDSIEANPIKSYSIVTSDEIIMQEELSYFAKLNPREGQIAEMEDNFVKLSEQYMA